jgi:hypothetical protein
MTINIAVVLIIRVLRTEEGLAERARKVLYVELLVARCDVRASEGLVAFCTNKVQATEIISFAKRPWLAVRSIYREELGGNNGSTVHAFETVQVEDCA